MRSSRVWRSSWRQGQPAECRLLQRQAAPRNERCDQETSRGTVGQPSDDSPRMGQSLDIGSEDLPRVPMQREPAAEIFWISTKFLEPEGAVVTQEDVDAIIAGRAVDGEHDTPRHGDWSRPMTRPSQPGRAVG